MHNTPGRRPSWWRRMLEAVSGYAGGTTPADSDDDAAGRECRPDTERHSR